MSTKYQTLQNFYKRITPGGAALGGALAGWFLSDTFVEAPRGQMTAAQRAEWERVITESLRRKNRNLGKALLKDHAPVPPRQGLMWDPVKKRWTRPENVGHTVAEVQGKKRIRGTGTGTHQRSIGSKTGMKRFEAQRKFREAGERRHKTTHRKGTSLKRFLARHKRRKRA